MESAVKAAGIPATFEPVDWNPPGLPSDPEEDRKQIAEGLTSRRHVHAGSRKDRLDAAKPCRLMRFARLLSSARWPEGYLSSNT